MGCRGMLVAYSKARRSQSQSAGCQEMSHQSQNMRGMPQPCRKESASTVIKITEQEKKGKETSKHSKH